MNQWLPPLLSLLALAWLLLDPRAAFFLVPSILLYAQGTSSARRWAEKQEKSIVPEAAKSAGRNNFFTSTTDAIDPILLKNPKKRVPLQRHESLPAPKAQSHQKNKEKKPEPERPETKKEQKTIKPKFRGSPEEILGVSHQAHTKTIIKAFRYWMKELHPDHHATESPTKQKEYSFFAQKIIRAKETLLEKRRQAQKKNAA